MKPVTTILLLLLASIAYAQHKAPVKYHHVKTIVTDLNHDQKLDTIVLSSSPGNSGEFNRISISLAGLGKKTFTAKQDWTTVDSTFLKKNKNAAHSNLIFVGSTPLHTVILLFGVQSSAGYRDEFSIINIENDEADMVADFDEDKVDVESPLFLKDLDNDGRLEFAYRNLHECVNGDGEAEVCGYNPFIIYTVDDQCAINKPLMKQYNQKHYVFAGYETDERILVYSPGKNGKYRLVEKSSKYYKGTR